MAWHRACRPPPGEVLTAGLVLSEAFYSSERVHGNDALIEGMVYACLEFVEVGMLGVEGKSHENVFAVFVVDFLVAVLLGIVEKVSESSDPFRGHVVERGGLVAVGLEVTEAAAPDAPVAFAVGMELLLTHLSVVCEEVGVRLELVEHLVAVALQFNLTFGTHGFCLCLGLTVLFLHRLGVTGQKIKFKELTASLAAVLDVQVETLGAIFEESLSELH